MFGRFGRRLGQSSFTRTTALRSCPYFLLPATAVLAEDFNKSEEPDADSPIDASTVTDVADGHASSNPWLDRLISNPKIREFVDEKSNIPRYLDTLRQKLSGTALSSKSDESIHSDADAPIEDSSSVNTDKSEESDVSDTSASDQGDEQALEEKLPRIFDDRPVRVAVIGAGIGGSSCAYFLKESLTDSLLNARDQPFSIDVFEAADDVGGRVFSDTLPNGLAIERGAGIMIDENKYMFDFTNKVRILCFFFVFEKV